MSTEQETSARRRRRARRRGRRHRPARPHAAVARRCPRAAPTRRDAARRPPRARCARRRASPRTPVAAARRRSATAYRRGGRRIHKTVHFYLFALRLGRHRRPRPRGRRGALDPARGGPDRAHLPRRAGDDRARAVQARRRPLGCEPHAGPQLLLDGLRRPDEARPQDRHDPARRQAPQVPQEPGRPGHRRLPVLAAREALPRGHRQRRGQADQGALARATSSTTTPSSAARRSSSTSWSRSTAARSPRRTR